MNKATKGTVAIAAAITLLLGGAGSLAYWQESASVAATSVSTGQLHVTVPTTGSTWTVKKNTTATATPITNISTFKMVPGDIVTYTVPFTTTAEGDNLTATGTVAWGAAATLPAGMTSSTSGTYNSVAFAGTTFAVVKQATPVNGQLVFTLTWDFGTTGNTTGMSQTINLAATTVTVQQTPAP